LVCFAWIFFRANNLTDAFVICSKFTTLPNELYGYIQGLSQTGFMGTLRQMFQLGTNVANPIQLFGLTTFGLSFIFIAILIIAENLSRKEAGIVRIMRFPLVVRWVGYYLLVIIIFLNIQSDNSAFIYFQF
jgi:hypothetical protein